MSRSRTALLVLGAMAAGAGTAAAIATALTGRSRPAVEELAELHVPSGMPPARVVALPGRGELFFRHHETVAADAPTIVLLHGWVTSADLNWFATYGAVAQRGAVIAADHRGHGRGSRPSSPFRLADVADDVAALLRHLEVGPVVLVGFSMGGPIGQLVWQRHPDLVAGMVLCATAAQFRYGPLGGEHWRLMGLYQMGTRLLPRAWMERALLAQIRGTAPVRLVQSIGPEVADFAPLLPWAVGEVERGDVEDLAEAGRQLGRFDSRGWIGGLDVPSAVVVTTRDRLIPPSIQLQLAGLLPDALVLEVDGDHDAPAGQATAFNQALLQALDHVLGRTGDG